MFSNLSFAGFMSQIAILAIDLGIAIVAISALRYLQGLMAGVNTTDELSRKDNFAFGVSISGNALALALIMAGVVTGEGESSLLHEFLYVGAYVILGIALLKIGTVINDKVIFHTFSLKEQVKVENMAAGIVQAANFISLGIIINSAIKWVESESAIGVLAIVMIFILAQVLLLALTRVRSAIYKNNHNGSEWQDALLRGNNAIAVRYAGFIISSALALGACGGLVVYLEGLLWVSALYWLLTAVITLFVLVLLGAIARRFILLGIDYVEEVDKQHNLGVAFIEASIFVAIGLIIYALMS